jgi:hypothetical protein
VAQKTVRVSDFSGDELSEDSGARITLTYNEAGNTVAVVADATLNDEIVKTIEQAGTSQSRRGRRKNQDTVAA